MSGPTADVLRILAPAKVNLTLAVLERRPDGYHELESWIAPIDLCDEITLTQTGELSLQVGSAFEAPLPPADRNNLVWRAAELLANAAGRRPSVGIKLLKRIPMEAGLGGGSSNAASTLLGLNVLWGLGWSLEKLSTIAEQLGSDVPLFLHASQAVIRGRGEIVEPLRVPWHGWLVLLVPDFGLSTPKVFSRWDDACSSNSSPQPIWDSLPCTAGDLSERLSNDLAAPAFEVEPRLRSLHERLNAVDATRIHMTGSGCTLFAVFDSRQEAEVWRGNVAAAAGENVRTHVVETLPPEYEAEACMLRVGDNCEIRKRNASS